MKQCWPMMDWLSSPANWQNLQMAVIEIDEESGRFELINPVIIEKREPVLMWKAV